MMKKNRNLIKAMEALLNIYNLELDLKKTDKWTWEKIKENLEVFANSIFTPVLKKSAPVSYKICSCFCDYTIEEKKLFIGPLALTVDIREIKDLYLLMDCLKQEARLDLIHFSILQLRSETFVNRNDQNLECYSGKSDTQVFYEIFDEGIRPLIENFDEKTEELIKQFFAQAKEYEGNLEHIKSTLKILFQYHNIPKKKSDYIRYRFLEIIKYLINRKNETSILNEMHNSSFNSLKNKDNTNKNYGYSQLTTQAYTHMSVGFKSKFANEIFKFKQKSIDERKQNEEHTDDELLLNDIPVLSYDSWKSFQEILVSFFVEYCFASDQFKNIKLCENEKCRKMILENRRNRRQFCSTTCRQAYFKKNPRNKCRDNQNKWIEEQFNLKNNEILINSNNKQLRLYAGKKILIDDCAECKEIVSRGYCPKIIIKNPILIDIKPKRRKKIIAKLKWAWIFCVSKVQNS